MQWQEFKAFAERLSAEGLSARLQAEGIPARVESTELGGAVESRFAVFVPNELLHRARWLDAQMIEYTAELEFLATGELPSQEVK